MKIFQSLLMPSDSLELYISGACGSTPPVAVPTYIEGRVLSQRVGYIFSIMRIGV